MTFNWQLCAVKNGETWDLTNSVESITISSTLYGAAGSLSCTLLDASDYPRGSVIFLTINGDGIFYGRVFEITVNQDGITTVLAYDNLRYFKNEETLYYEGLTAQGIFADLCTRADLIHKIVDESTYTNLGALYSGKTMFSIMETTTEETFLNTNELFFIRDNYGTLEFVNVANRKTDLIIGTGSLLTGYTYTQSIEDSYNVIKLYRDNSDTATRDVWQAQDSETMLAWGKLQYLDEVDEDASEEQIKALAETALTALNREHQTLTLTAVGFYNLKAGDGIKIEIDGLIDEWFYLNSVETTIKNGDVTMNLEVVIP